jgi:hypothetical protein
VYGLVVINVNILEAGEVEKRRWLVLALLSFSHQSALGRAGPPTATYVHT